MLPLAAVAGAEWPKEGVGDPGLKRESESCSVVSDCFQLHGLYSPWNSPGQNTEVGSLSFLQGIFPTQGSNPGALHCRQILWPPVNSRFGFRERRGGARGSGSVYRAGMYAESLSAPKMVVGQM